MIAPEAARPAIERIGEARLVPVIRVDSAGVAVDLCERLLAAGVRALELTATTPGWVGVISELRGRHPGALVGAGTVLTAEAARAALDAGAQFLVSPYPAPEVRAFAAERAHPFIEGGFTPGELAAAASRGIAKLFPARVAGTAMLRSFLSVMPGARVVPTGGIGLADVAEWLAAGAYAVGVGSALAATPELEARIGEIVGRGTP